MISEQMEAALNDQLNFELFSAYIYYSMEAYYHSLNLPGFANWMHVQAQEEMVHVSKFYTFIHDRAGRVLLKALDAPKTAWDNPLSPFENGLAHERLVTARINKLVDLAIEEHDHATNSFLQWFVTEQVEEEANADAVIKKMQLMGDDRSGLFMMNTELAARVFVPPTTTAA